MLWPPVRAVCVVLMMASQVLSGCSTTDKIPEYMSDRMSPPLEIPPDLDKPVFNEGMKIPELPVTGDGASGNDAPVSAPSDTRSIEKPPVFLEEKK